MSKEPGPDIATTYTVYRPDGTRTIGCVMWPAEPGYGLIKELIEPLLDEERREDLEHVTVLHEGKRADMFVAECGRLPMTWRPPLSRNEDATTIYRNNYLTQHPGFDPEKIADIRGVAILFDRQVWF